MHTIHGVPLISNPVLVKEVEPARQVRFPRSKKRRIRKKWRQDSANWEPAVKLPDPDLYRMTLWGRECFVGHPATVARLYQMLEARGA